jgi:hypothetical protein
MTGIGACRARRWVWALTAIAITSMGGLYQALRSAPGTGTALLLLFSAIVLALSGIQAARILAVLSSPRRPVRQLWTRRADGPGTAARVRAGTAGPRRFRQPRP